MTITPTGFTDISSVFNRIDPPSVSGLSADSPSTTIFGARFVEVQETFSEIIETASPSDLTLVLQSENNYVQNGTRLNFRVSLEPKELITSGTIVLRQLTPEILSSDKKSNYGSIHSNQVTISEIIDTELEYLQFVAHPALSSAAPSKFISSEEYSNIAIKSNLITIFILRNDDNDLVNNQPPSTSVITAQPLHDAVITSIEKVLRTTLVDRVIDLAPTNQSPRGSSGAGIYKDIGIPSPMNSSMHKQVPNDSLQRLLGMALDQIKRLEGWASKVLFLTHSDKSLLPNSELNLLLNLLPSSLTESLERYAELLGEAGKHASDTAKTYAPDYAQGNTVVKSNAVEQHNVRQYRVQTSSAFDVNSPSINFAAQQSVSQFRFEHHAGDLYQGSHQHIFVRAEDEMTSMSSTGIRYTSKELGEYSANVKHVTGGATYYQDTEWDQVGQASQIPIHLTNTDLSSLGLYGNSTKLVQEDYKLLTNLGKVEINSGTHFHALSKLGNIELQSATGQTNIKGATKVSIYSAQQVDTYCAGTTSISSVGKTQIASISSLVMKGKLVLINCGGVVKPKVPNPLIPVVAAPKVFLPLLDAAPYIKSNPVSPGSSVQNIPMTPEPASTPAGSSSLGSFLTNPSK